MARNHLIQLRRDTEANWTSTDPVLAEGEVGLVTDTNELVVGDGATAFSSLARFIDKATASGTYANPASVSGQRLAVGSAAPVDSIITTFASGHGAVADGTGTSDLNDTSDYALGSQSAQVTTDGASSAQRLTLTGLSVDATGKNLRVWLKVTNLSRILSVQAYVGSGGSWSNYWRWDIQTNGDESANRRYLHEGEWTVVDLPWTSIVQTSGSPNVAAIDRLRIAVTDDSSGTVTVNVGGWALVSPSSTFPSGVVSLTFDDGYDDQFDKARPAMDAYGYRGTAYVVQDLIGQSGYMTLDQLKALKRLNGWEIGGHAKESDTHTNRFTSLTSSELDLELREHRQWLIENGLDADSLAYPGGVYTPTVAEIVGRLFPVARTTFSQLLEVQAPTDRLRLRAYNIVDTTPVATITDLIDDAVANDEWLILIFHRIEDTASSTISYDTADFESVLSHLDSNSVEVAPVREVMARLAD